MSIRVSSTNLGQAIKDLQIEWQRTKEVWRDVKSLEFDRRYLEDLPMMVSQAHPLMEEIDALIRKVRQDCE
jgi:hypothetical protein